MLIIRNSQLDSLKQDKLADFEDRAHRHLRRIYPGETASLKDAELLELIRYGIGRAGKYEIRIEADVVRYLEYMIYFDRNFDTDDRYHWAGSILREKSLSGRVKIKRIDRVVGHFAAN